VLMTFARSGWALVGPGRTWTRPNITSTLVASDGWRAISAALGAGSDPERPSVPRRP
jgi:hypothetical protein